MCGDNGCFWWSLALEFFKNNTQIDRQRLAASLRKIMSIGPCKEARVPTIIGEPNCAKSTVLDPIRSVFGKAAVLGKPKLGAANDALSRMAKETSVLYILTITGQWIMQRIQKKILLCQSPTS